jgi:hypothetical protein
MYPTFIKAQLNTSAATVTLLNEQKEKFFNTVTKISVDSNIVIELSGYIESEAEHIRLYISNSSLPDSEKTKAINSLGYFFKYADQNIDERKMQVFEVADALGSYKDVLYALLNHTSLSEILKPLDPRRSRLLANAFWQYDRPRLLEDIALYKLIASNPENILPFLKNNPGFRFADSLMYKAAVYDPAKAIPYLRQHKNSFLYQPVYIKQIVALSQNKFASELIPFAQPLHEKKISIDEILEKRLEVTGYFQLLVNTLKNEITEKGDSFLFCHLPLRNGIKEKALSFYVNFINEQHSSPAQIRFSAVNGLRPEDLYYVITSCEEELYTSSYLGLYNRMMDQLKDHPVDSIFELVQYDNFRVFMRMAANYNTLADFLNRLPLNKKETLVRRFIAELEKNPGTGLEKTMEVADSFTGLVKDENMSKIISNELRTNLERNRTNQLFLGMHLYRILTQVFDLVREKDPANKLRKQLGDYEVLRRSTLQNKNGKIIELVMFYGDEDGIASFNNFLVLFKDTKLWTIEKNDYWVTIQSLSESPLIIYANLPLSAELEADVQAQDSLSNFLERESLKPSILIHRGHSYHINKTFARLQPSVKLALLGSCGGYKNIITIANISPMAQIIASKKMGSKFINEPLIGEINRNLLESRDLVWSVVWEELEKKFAKDEFKLNLFNEYLPPEKSISLFVLKLYNYYK